MKLHHSLESFSKPADDEIMVSVTKPTYAFVRLPLLSLSRSRRQHSFVFLRPLSSSSFTKSKCPSVARLVHARARALLVMDASPEKTPSQLPFEQQQDDIVSPQHPRKMSFGVVATFAAIFSILVIALIGKLAADFLAAEGITHLFQ